MVMLLAWPTDGCPICRYWTTARRRRRSDPRWMVCRPTARTRPPPVGVTGGGRGAVPGRRAVGSDRQAAAEARRALQEIASVAHGAPGGRPGCRWMWQVCVPEAVHLGAGPTLVPWLGCTSRPERYWWIEPTAT